MLVFCCSKPTKVWFRFHTKVETARIVKVTSSSYFTEQRLCSTKPGIGGHPKTTRLVPASLLGHYQNPPPLSFVWNGSASVSITIFFSRVDKSQHGDLQLGEQPFGYVEPCLH